MRWKYCSCVKLVYKAKQRRLLYLERDCSPSNELWKRSVEKPVRKKNDPPMCSKQFIPGTPLKFSFSWFQRGGGRRWRTRRCCCVRAWLQLCNCILCFYCGCVRLFEFPNKCFLCSRPPACFSYTGFWFFFLFFQLFSSWRDSIFPEAANASSRANQWEKRKEAVTRKQNLRQNSRPWQKSSHAAQKMPL